MAKFRTYLEVITPEKLKRRFSTPGIPWDSNLHPCSSQYQDILLHINSSVKEELEYCRYARGEGYNPY